MGTIQQLLGYATKECLFDAETADECPFYMPTIESGKLCKYEKRVVYYPGGDEFDLYFECKHCDE